MTGSLSTSERVYRRLAEVALDYGERPGWPPGELRKAREACRNIPTPNPGADLYLWNALVRLAEAFGVSDLPRRRALARPLGELAAYCLETIGGPAPATQVAPPRAYRDD